MVNIKIGVFWKEKINESNLSHVEFELLMGYARGAAQQEHRNAVQEIWRRLRVENNYLFLIIPTTKQRIL